MHKSAATTTPYSVQEPPQRHPHCYDTDDDGDAGEAGDDGDDATSRRAGSTTQQELSSSGGPRGCIRQWLHRHALVGSGGSSGAAVVTGAFVVLDSPRMWYCSGFSTSYFDRDFAQTMQREV
ncbi:hypothetical protein EDB86DRAFT_2825705 [Lactarius hatsudake]|nr:hypothetical protein EDB86DRAFT_2825705 [Lactarius hatsudake]